MRPAGYFLSSSLNEGLGSGNFSLDASNSINLTTTTVFNMAVAGVYSATIGLNSTTNVAGSTFLSSGMDSREVVAAKKMIDAHGEIHLRCGKSEIVMKSDGTITMKSARIDLNS